MRVFMKVEMPVVKSNQVAREGLLGRRIQEILDDLQPEAAYFLDSGGKRAAYLFVELESPSDIPKLAEPWFLAFDAEVEIHPVMNRDDLASASGFIEAAAKHYAA